MAAIDECIKSGNPLPKNKIRSLVPKKDVEECIQHFVDIGFRFLHRLLLNSPRYKFIDLQLPGKLRDMYEELNEKEFNALRFKNTKSTPASEDNSELTFGLEDDWENEMKAKVKALHGNILLVTFTDFFCGKLGFTKDHLIAHFDRIQIKNFNDDGTNKRSQSNNNNPVFMLNFLWNSVRSRKSVWSATRCLTSGSFAWTIPKIDSVFLISNELKIHALMHSCLMKASTKPLPSPVKWFHQLKLVC